MTIQTRFEAPARVIPLEEVADFTRFLELIQEENIWGFGGPLRDD